MAAISAAKALELESEPGSQFVNYLVIHSLSYQIDEHPRDQLIRLTIEQMASGVMTWHKVIHLNNQYFYQAMANNPKVDFTKLLFEKIGINRADQIYLMRNRDFFNSRLMVAFGSAKKICYGDSFGVYYDQDVVTNSYYFNNFLKHGPANFLKLVLRWFDMNLIDWGRQRDFNTLYPLFRENKIKIYDRKTFDIGCYVDPIGLGSGSGEVLLRQQVPLIVIKEVLKLTGIFLDQIDLKNFQKKLIGRKILFFLPTFFSHRKDISSHNENQAYKFFLNKLTTDFDLLIFKFHPRSNPEDIKKLKQDLNFKGEIIFWDETPYSLLPLEVVFRLLFLDLLVAKKCQLEIVTFRTSTLGLAKIFQITSTVGFGFWLVLKYFKKPYAFFRLWEEHLIKKRLKNILLEKE